MQMLNRHWPRLALAGALLWYATATLPYLADFPVVELAQIRIVEPAYFLATQGVYGNALLTGWYHAESAYHEYMPLYAWLVALAFKILGPSIWAARLVSVLGGGLTLWLTYQLGQQLDGAALGVLGAWVLCALKLAVPILSEVERIGFDPNTSGIPLLDLARVIRFDIWIPVWGLGACCLFLWAQARGSRWGYAGVGVLTGLATLTHLYGVFFLMLFIGLLIWMEGPRVFYRWPLYLMLGAFALTLLPWGLYVSQDLYAYRGQMLPQAGRFDLLNPLFYLDNLVREPWRYLSWLGGSFRHPILLPRIGFWLTVVSVPVAARYLWGQSRQAPTLRNYFALTTLPILALLLAVLINFKRYYYVLLVLPFLALYIAAAILAIWRAPGRRPLVTRIGLGLILAAAWLEGGLGIAQNLQLASATTPYLEVADALVQHLPQQARLLLAEPFWLGFTHFTLSGSDRAGGAQGESRSIHLAFLLSDKRYYADPPTVAQVIDAIHPDYVVAQNYFLDDYLRPGAPFQNPTSVQQWSDLRDYLDEHCPNVTFTLNDKSYGSLSLYRCEGASR